MLRQHVVACPGSVLITFPENEEGDNLSTLRKLIKMADSLFLQTLITDHLLITLRAESPLIFLENIGILQED